MHPITRHNLRWFRLDGVFAQASESTLVAYLSLFILTLGATGAQIGMMSALSNLSAALLLLLGGVVAERWGHRKAIVLLGGGGGARLVLLLLAFIPWVLSGPTAVYVAIGLVVARTAFANLSVPAWTALIADTVPLSLRGRYFSSRNIAMGVAGIVTTYLVGQLITRAGDPIGYQLALAIAFTLGLASTFSFSRIRESSAPVTRPALSNSSRLPLLRHVLNQPDFLRLCAIAGLWNASINVAAPFFSVYLVENLAATASIVGTLTVIQALAALPGQRLFGGLNDRWGARRVQLVTGLLIPLLPLGWLFAGSPWHLVPVHLIGGFTWAGYGLASFNFLLMLTPEDRRSTYTALYQIVVTLALAGGAALGGVIVSQWGYPAVFILSCAGRGVATLLFARFVHQPAAQDSAKPLTQRPKRRGLLRTARG